MNSPRVGSPNGEELRERLRDLRSARRARQIGRDKSSRRRAPLKPRERNDVFAKTAGRCHICGGAVDPKNFEADHVFAHSAGGAHAADNYLPAHSLCNNYRWDYSAEEFQWVLKIGVWARLKMEQGGRLGDELLWQFVAYERRRTGRKSHSGRGCQC